MSTVGASDCMSWNNFHGIRERRQRTRPVARPMYHGQRYKQHGVGLGIHCVDHPCSLCSIDQRHRHGVAHEAFRRRHCLPPAPCLMMMNIDPSRPKSTSPGYIDLCMNTAIWQNARMSRNYPARSDSRSWPPHSHRTWPPWNLLSGRASAPSDRFA